MRAPCRAPRRIQARGARRGIDDPEYLGSRCLLLQRLARLGNQARVLHCNDRLRGEVLQQRDLLVGEGADFLAVDYNCPEQRIVLAQRHVGATPSTTPQQSLCPWPARIVGFAKVSRIDNFTADKSIYNASRHGGHRLLQQPNQVGWYSLEGYSIKSFAIPGAEHTESALADPGRPFEHRVEHRR